MKIKKFNFQNNELVQIYINKSEYKDTKIIEEINQLKQQYSNISIFISGEKDSIKTIKEMLNYQKSKNVK